MRRAQFRIRFLLESFKISIFMLGLALEAIRGKQQLGGRANEVEDARRTNADSERARSGGELLGQTRQALRVASSTKGQQYLF